MTPVTFGFLAEATHLTWSEGEIKTLPEHSAIVEGILRDECVSDGWFYPPVCPLKVGQTAPLVSKGFALPATHVLKLNAPTEDADMANFLIALFGMLKGQRFQRSEWQHLYKAPIKSKLNDFFAGDQDISKALHIASEFWVKNIDSATRRLAFGALHWHLFAQLYEHEFERFNAQYMALDACSKLALAIRLPGYPEGNLPHAKRAQILCEHTNVPAPIWVNADQDPKSCPLARRRNELIHEAMYIGQPVGFAHPTAHKNMALELTGLVARIYLRLLGTENEYTQSECTTRSQIGFKFN